MVEQPTSIGVGAMYGQFTDLFAQAPGGTIHLGCWDGSAESVWPSAVTQLCVVHLIRSALKYVDSTDPKKVAAALKPAYTALAST